MLINGADDHHVEQAFPTQGRSETDQSAGSNRLYNNSDIKEHGKVRKCVNWSEMNNESNLKEFQNEDSATENYTLQLLLLTLTAALEQSILVRLY